MKKVFVTNWGLETVQADIDHVPLPRARFFNKLERGRLSRTEIIAPDDITYDQLCFFIGRKTKVTIETIE